MANEMLQVNDDKTADVEAKTCPVVRLTCKTTKQFPIRVEDSMRFMFWLRSFVVILAFSAFEAAHSAAAGAESKTSVVSVSDPSFQSCQPHVGAAAKPILANRNLCVLVFQTGSLRGHVEVNLIGPTTIGERNGWINEVGKWLKTKGLDPCAEKTGYLTDSESVKPPLAEQVAGIPGEKAFYGLGGLDKPSFCPQPCRWGSLDRRGQCSKGIPLPQRSYAH